MKGAEVWRYYNQACAEAFNERRYIKAMQILKQALHEVDEIGELESPILSRADALAEIYVKQGQYKDAAALYRILLECKRKVLGASHPDVKVSAAKLASVLCETGGLTPNLLSRA